MTRRHADLIEVSTWAAPSGAEPAEFGWRGRRYLVREVLARWTESGTWWRGAAVRALNNGAEAQGELDDRPQQWWRVEADSGRLAAMSAGPGVYDLCLEQRTAAWTLKRVMD